MRLQRIAVYLALVACVLTPAAHAQVKASLVAADSTVQPGKPFTVALRMVHEPHWHTYWINPGTGLATSLDWKLPPGWKAGDIQWPAPKVIKDDKGNVTGNGFDGDQLLPVTITPAADAVPGTKVELKATAAWLMCNDVCKPGDDTVSLTLTVASDAPASDPEWGPRIAAEIAGLPRSDAAWSVTASKAAKAITLQVSPAGGAQSGHVPKDLHFFADDNLVAYDQPQSIRDDGKGGFVLDLPISPDGPQAATRLVGDLTSSDGWESDGSLKGLRVDVAFSGSVAAAAAGGGAAAAAATPVALGGTLILAFFGGLILNLMPCVFPVLGIKILGFVNQAGTDRRKVAAHGLVFTSGVLLSFWFLAGLLAILRSGGAQLGWGFQLQSPVFIFCLAAGMLVFALNLSGVFEFGLSATGVGGGLQMKTGLSGSFFTGILATVVATPCSAPFLAPALGAALTLSFIASFAVFTTIAIGLSTPYLLLSIFPAAVRVLPRPGAWMETFKQFMAFPLYATVGYLIWVLAGQVPDNGLLSAFFGLVLVAMGIWVYGRWRAPGASEGRARFGLIAGLLLIGLGAWTGWPRKPEATDITWDKWSPEAVQKLRGDGRIVYVDFTARWCATCQANKRVVFHSDEVLKVIHSKNVATLRGDWTNQDPLITAELAKYHRSAVPFNLIWLPNQENPVTLPELLTPGIVLKALGEPAK